MDTALKQKIIPILETGQDLSLATLREDGGPQVTTVSYASDGLAIYFGTGGHSQKACNLARDPRVSLTIDLPYRHWNEIRGLSIGGRARRITDPATMVRVGQLFIAKFQAEMAQFVSGDMSDLALFEIVPEVVSVLDYSQGFGHNDLIRLVDAA